MNERDGVEVDESLLLTKLVDLLTVPEYQSAQNSLHALYSPERSEVVRAHREITTHEKQTRPTKGEAAAGVFLVASMGGDGEGGRQANHGRSGKGLGRGGGGEKGAGCGPGMWRE